MNSTDIPKTTYVRPGCLSRFVRRLSAFAWGWEIARTKDHAMLVKCHEDNCRAMARLAHETEQANKAEQLARVQLAAERVRANECEETANFYRKRYRVLERNQHRMRDPERRIVCDALANGELLPDPYGVRYGLNEKAQPRPESGH